MKNASCDTCLFHEDGYCKRFPPALSVVLQDNEIQPVIGYPSVSHDDRCGEYEEDTLH